MAQITNSRGKKRYVYEFSTIDVNFEIKEDAQSYTGKMGMLDIGNDTCEDEEISGEIEWKVSPNDGKLKYALEKKFFDSNSSVCKDIFEKLRRFESDFKNLD